MYENSKVYIAVNGIGLGHARRSRRIGIALRRAGSRVFFSTYKNTPAVYYLKKSNFPVIELPELSWAQSDDGGIDPQKTLLKAFYGWGVPLHHLLADYIVMKKIKPKIVISDYRAAPVIISKLLGIPCFMLGLYFDLKNVAEGRLLKPAVRLLGGFLKKLSRWCIKTFLTDLPPPYTIYEKVMPESIPKNFVFTGPIIDSGLEKMIKNRDLEEVKIDAKRKLRISERKKVFLFIPSGVKKSRLKFIANCLEIMPELKKIKEAKFIITMAMPELELKKYCIGDNIEIWNWIPNITNYLLASDVVIGYYGMNKVFDSLAAGAWFLGLVAKNQIEQKAIAMKISEMQLGSIISDFRKDLLKTIKDVLADEEYRKRVIRIAKIISTYNPIETIVNEIAQYLD